MSLSPTKTPIKKVLSQLDRAHDNHQMNKFLKKQRRKHLVFERITIPHKGTTVHDDENEQNDCRLKTMYVSAPVPHERFVHVRPGIMPPGGIYPFVLHGCNVPGNEVTYNNYNNNKMITRDQGKEKERKS